jgi:RTX calcium-binding nonapeptide repeat (4 copies)/PA domain
VPALALVRTALFAAAVTLLLVVASTAAAQGAGSSTPRPFDPPPLSDGLDTVVPQPDSGHSQFGQHGPATEHLPAVRENVELVSKLEMSTPAELRTPETADQAVLPGQIADLAVYKNFAYLNSWSEDTCRRGGIFVVDISNPAQPRQVAFRSAAPNTRHGEGAHVITIGTMDVLAVNNEPLPPPCPQGVPSGAGVDLWNVTDPRNPVPLARSVGDTGPPGELVGAEPVHHAHSNFMWKDDSGRAFIVMTDNDEFGVTDVDIWEITNPAAPRPVADHNLRALFPQIEDNSAYGDVMNHHDVVVKKVNGVQTMLVSYWDAGYVTLNVDDPANPRYIGDTSFDGPDPLFPDRNPPEGNAHQAEFSHDNRWILAADEDFNPYRFDARITSGTWTDFELVATQGSDVPLIGPGNPLIGDTRFVGEACNTSPPAPAAGMPIALVARGTCTFQEKYDNVVAAGYEGGIVFNSNSTVSGCDSLLTMAVEGDEIPFLFIPRSHGFRIMDAYDPATYECTPGDPANTTPNPAAPRESESVLFEALFDGWGYTHLYENGSGKMRHVGAFAIEESRDERFALEFGDLSVHEFAADATENVAYSSYYAGGMRVFTFGPGGLTETGKFIDRGGNNFWGVEQFTLGNQRYFAGSDRDFGLYIFRYTGAGAAVAPACSDVTVMVPYRRSARVPLTCSDANNNPLGQSRLSAPANGTVADHPPAGGWTYTHTGRRLGPAGSFQFRANDGALDSNAATASLVAVARNGGRCFNPFVGSSRNDVIFGSRFGDRIRGGRGRDTVRARAGADCVSGGPDSDRLIGQRGRDRLAGNRAADRLFGGPGRDRLIGAQGNDGLQGHGGADRLSGGRGPDRVNGGGGNDRISVGGATNRASGGPGNDRISARNGKRDKINCGRGNDRVRADRNDSVSGNCETVRRGGRS